ncbi:MULTISPECIES: GNAT family N-acetyltransferase [unclassified Clostridium]|uniref:GNAT family N-acetyltransferase n=1 Tax=unclassified Clostridium TaxID=2614128 RepID=UPI002908E82A|nr:GNAT family N-acetyltransferase [Clostridium sp.]MDU5106994.1 GNAT family N-acetyltransferase [Clostridium sp.]
MVGFDVRNVNSKDYNDIVRLSEDLDYSSIKSIIEDENSKIIVAQLNDEIIGYINFTILNDTSYKSNLAIKEIMVEEKYRGLGVGHQLMIEAKKYAADYNAASIVAIYNNYKEEEVYFYNKEGFRLNDERRYEKLS